MFLPCGMQDTCLVSAFKKKIGSGFAKMQMTIVACDVTKGMTFSRTSSLMISVAG